ncbi:40S ribosomal protein [Arachis hypogaea]|nr:40S ribosomal protein [Arachis hypogaea]
MPAHGGRSKSDLFQRGLPIRIPGTDCGTFSKLLPSYCSNFAKYHNSLLSIAGISGFCQVVPLSTIICFDDFIEIIAEEPEQFNNRSKEGTCKSMLKEVHKNHDYIVIDDGDDDGDDERHSKPLLMKKRTNTEELIWTFVQLEKELTDSNYGPREDATRIGSAGVVRRQAVDILPLCRVNQAIYLLTTGAREAAFRNIKTIVECLADELINAAKAMLSRKKDEIERVAKANR